jgi:hypothetical protein
MPSAGPEEDRGSARVSAKESATERGKVMAMGLDSAMESARAKARGWDWVTARVMETDSARGSVIPSGLV